MYTEVVHCQLKQGFVQRIFPPILTSLHYYYYYYIIFFQKFDNVYIYIYFFFEIFFKIETFALIE